MSVAYPSSPLDFAHNLRSSMSSADNSAPSTSLQMAEKRPSGTCISGNCPKNCFKSWTSLRTAPRHRTSQASCASWGMATSSSGSRANKPTLPKQLPLVLLMPLMVLSPAAMPPPPRACHKSAQAVVCASPRPSKPLPKSLVTSSRQRTSKSRARNVSAEHPLRRQQTLTGSSSGSRGAGTACEPPPSRSNASKQSSQRTAEWSTVPPPARMAAAHADTSSLPAQASPIVCSKIISSCSEETHPEL
mmetsp:Transcript_30980/g.89235  ORF Transcript_30980/g.89235 Transcript_30980/m.89235 type:complete len:246 (-) Transcript_30980:1326-2063(-)